MKYENFDLSGKKSHYNVGTLITNLHRDIADQIDKNTSITHYIKNYGFLPPWVLVNILTFGRTSKFYSNLKQCDRQQLCKNINNNIFENEMKNYLEFVSIMRNLCAHSERLYNYKCHVRLKHNKIYDELDFSNSNKNDIFALLVCLKLLISVNDFNVLIEELKLLLSSLNNSLTSASMSQVIKSMGFPENWENINM